MSVWRYASRCLSILMLSASAVCAFAQAPSAEYTPEVGQSGKDVVWVPSPQELVDKMLDMAKVTPKDYVIDLGSGDGRTVITAAKRGARALGVEFNPDMVALSRRNAAKAGVGDKATFVEADIFRSDLSPATVITLFLLTDLNLKLRPTILCSPWGCSPHCRGTTPAAVWIPKGDLYAHHQGVDFCALIWRARGAGIRG
ncbi:MAG: methyltransferase domain-containing protein [Betaproteobacteria bacterium]|nr:MAG: methyltransferase domain-containing protein [Betaproteobacteria bacterium]